MKKTNNVWVDSYTQRKELCAWHTGYHLMKYQGFSMKTGNLRVSAQSLNKKMILCITLSLSLFLSEVSLATTEIIAKTSLTIDEAVKLAMQNNPMLGASRSDALAAAERIAMAKAQLKPSLSTTSFITRGDAPGILSGPASIMPSAITSYTAQSYYGQNVMLMAPLDVSKRLRKNVFTAGETARAASLDSERVRQDTAVMVRMAYYDALFMDKEVELMEAASAVAKEQLSVDTAMVDAGKIPAFYIDRDKAEYAMSEQGVEEARRDAAVARLRLAQAIGVDPASQFNLTTTLAPPDMALLTPFSTVATGSPEIAASPEIASAKARTSAAESSLIAARKAFKPDLSLVFMLDRMKTPEMDATTGTTAAIIAAMPIRDGGMRKAAAREAAAMRDSSLLEKRNTELKTQADYLAAKLTMETAVKNIDVSDAAIKFAEENLKVVKLRYEAGKSVLVEVLDANAVLTRAKTNRIQAIRDALIARDNILRICGKL